MSRCYNCSENFSFFKKAVTCANCNFAFCSKCCNEKTNVPKKENKLLVVCSKCKQLIKNSNTGQQQSELASNISLPNNFLKLVESNKAKASTNVSSGQSSNVHDPNKEIAERLEKLKKDDKSRPAVIPSDKELEQRLLKLQYGENLPMERPRAENLPKQDVIKTPDDLINQLKNEAELDKLYDEYEKNELSKLEQRLNNLKTDEAARAAANSAAAPVSSDQEKPETNNKPKTDDLENLDAAKTNKIMEQLLKEIKIDANDDDDDPWCCMCNGDAELRCIDCENDFYCKKCFKKIHVVYEYKNHKITDLKK